MGELFAVFLRGINVGGVRIAMKDLQQVLAAAGFAEVRTLLASGNVVLAADADAETVKARVESVLRERFGYDAWVIVKTAPQVHAIIAGYPFGTTPGLHAYAVLTTEAGTVDDVVDALEPSPTERWQAAGDVLYWEVPKGSSLDTNLSKRLAKAKYKPLVTTRNLNTMEKVAAALG
ncbi:DUF1697 domain-containing protein [Arthrobacter ginkgonis]|uniref:DUF1697 domain-containing protein n=1 Tax=Arthrobacter ginkgonis TaxID=1630594 RepID=A0ABP7CNX2_9MICC